MDCVVGFLVVIKKQQSVERKLGLCSGGRGGGWVQFCMKLSSTLAHTISIALVPLSMELDREVNTECSSTEEMLASIHALSARDGIWEQVIWSLGIVALDQG